MKKTAFLFACVLFVFSAVASHAREHDSLVTSVLNPGTLPPKGIYLTLGYTAGRAVQNWDQKGLPTHSNYSFNTWSVSAYMIWVPGFKILGADYGMRLAIASVENTLVNRPQVGFNPATGPIYTNINQRGAGMSDPMFIPFSLGWHFPRVDVNLEVATFIPIGYYRYSGVAVGQDHWTFSPKLGATFYFDADKTWSISAQFAYEANLRNIQNDIKQGDQMYLHYTFAKKFGQFVTLGAIGYASWKVMSDSGKAVPKQDQGALDSVYSLGPEIRVFIPQIKTTVSLKYIKEFCAKGRGDMDFFRATVGWRF